MRVLVDTCVIMDAIQNREPFADDAKKIFRAAASNCLQDVSQQNHQQTFII